MIYTSQPVITEEMKQAVSKVFDDDEMLVGGKQVDLFEKEFADYIGTRYAVALSSGTDAITISLRCLNITKEVITTPLSFVATPEGIVLAGATPRFADIDNVTSNIDPENIRKKITKKTQAIMPVHLYGLPCDMKQIMEIADDNNLIVIEDSAQAHGAEFDGKKVGSIGKCGCWSFYATKNMTTGGNGGMITTNNKGVYDTARLLREHGGANNSTMIGYNARMNTINAAIGRVQLSNLDKWNRYRNTIADIYSEKLKELDFRFPLDDSGRVYHLFVVRFKQRDLLQKALREKGVYCGVHYPKPLHKLPPFSKYVDGKFPVAERHCKENISLPCSPILSRDNIEYVCDGIKEVRGVV